MKNNRNLTATIILLALVPRVYAVQQHSFEVGVEANYTDNVFQQVDNKETDTELSLLLGVDFEHSTQNSILNINYNSRMSEYLQDSYDRRTSVNGTGRIDVFSDSKLIGWFVSGDQQDTVIDVVGTNTPDNFSQRSVYSTGPIINIRINARNSIRLEGISSRTVIEVSDADSETLSAAVTWERKISSRTRFNFSFMNSTVQPEIFTIDEYDQEDISVGMSHLLRYGQISASYGLSKVDQLEDAEGDTLDTEVYDLALSLRLTRWSLTLTSAQQLQSSGENGFFSETDFDIGSQEFGVEINKRNKISVNLLAGPGSSGFTLDYSDIYSESPLTGSVREMDVKSIGYAYYFDADDYVNLRYARTDSNDAVPGIPERELERNSMALSYTKGIGRSLDAICGISRQERQFADSANEAISNSGYCSLNYVF